MSIETMRICPFCERTFDGKNIKNHIGAIHLGLKPLEVKSNEKQENILKQAHEHIETLKIERTKIKQCKFCGKTLTKGYHKHVLKCEQKVNNDFSKKKYQCDSCKRGFDEQYSLNRHYRSVHEKIKYQ